jgi:hypothetical protein
VRFAARLIATRRQLGGYRHTTVGKLVRSSVKAGKLRFSLVLNRRGRRALASRGLLRLTVRATADGPVGATVTAFGRVTLRR